VRKFSDRRDSPDMVRQLLVTRMSLERRFGQVYLKSIFSSLMVHQKIFLTLAMMQNFMLAVHT
jgi:hypothetical protein